MTTYYINTEMLGDATDDDAKIMVAFLQKKGFDVEFTTDCGAINCHPYDDEVEQLKQKIGDVWWEGLQYITTHKSAAALGRKGGSVRSAAKTAAARKNACNVSNKTRQERSERMKLIHEGKRVIAEFGASAVAQWFDGVGDGSYLKADKDYDYAVAKKIREGKGQYDVGLFADMIREALDK